VDAATPAAAAPFRKLRRDAKRAWSLSKQSLHMMVAPAQAAGIDGVCGISLRLKERECIFGIASNFAE
jgi:hypothetical protein